MKFENYLQKKNAMLETLQQANQESTSLNENVQHQNIQPLNENAGEEMMKLIKDMVKYAKLAPAYKKLKQSENDLKLSKDEQLLDFDENAEEKKEQIIDGVKAKFKAQKEQINNNSQLDATKKKIAREKINQQQEAVLAKVQTTAGDRVANEKAVLGKKLDKEIKEISDEITKLTSDYKLESALLGAQWDKERSEFDFELEIDLLNKQTDLKAERSEDPERQATLKKKADERMAKIKKDMAKEIQDAEAKEKEIETELNNKLNSASGDAKEALTKLKEFQAALTEYPKLAKIANDNPDDDDKQDDANLQKKKLNELKGKINKGLIKKAGLTTDDAEAEELATTFVSSADNLLKQMKEAGLDTAGAASGESKKIAELKEKGYSETSEKKSDLEQVTKQITLADNSTKDVKQWKVQEVTKKDGKVVTLKKELMYDDQGAVTNEGRKYSFVEIDSFFEDFDYDYYINMPESELNTKIENTSSRIVPTFESFIQKYKNRF
jgi:hypothetical protein